MTRAKKHPIAAKTFQPRFKLTKLVQAIRSISTRKSPSPRQQIKFESLEPRVLLSADPLTAALAAPFASDWSQQAETIELDQDAFADLSPALERQEFAPDDYFQSEDPFGETLVLGRSLDEFVRESVSDSWIVSDNATQVEQHIVFVDSRVEGYESLLDSVLPVAENKDGPVPVIEVVLLDADRDGVEQISEYLAEQQGVSAIHILAHGSEGSLSLGSSTLDTASLDEYSAQLGRWANALTADADILLYGCNVASGEWGAEFVNNFASLIGTDVAASDDATGNAALGGDWDLELQIGSIQSQPLTEFFDARQLTSLLQDGSIEVLDVKGATFSEFTKGQVIASDILNLSTKIQNLEWTIGAKGEVTIKSGSDLLKVKGAEILFAGSGANTFIITNNAEFGLSANPGQIIGNQTAGSTSTLSFTPNLDNPDALYTSKRVSSGINKVDLDSSSNVISFGKVWFTATSITKVVGGKGNDVFEGKDSASSILVGGRGDDTLIGGSQPGDLLQGGVGKDVLIGGLGSDFLEGGDGDDNLYGAEKDVSLATPEAGADSLAGGKGDDTYHFLGNWGNDLVDEKSGEGRDTLDFSAVNVALDVELGLEFGSPLQTGVRVSDPANASNKAEATNVEIVELGQGANSILVLDKFSQDKNNILTVINALVTTAAVQADAEAILDLSNVATGVEITVSAYTYAVTANGAEIQNKNGNKVTVTFASGAKLIVFNVKDIVATGQNDKVVIEEGAVLAGDLDLGDGKNELTVRTDPANLKGLISGGTGFDVLNFDIASATLLGLTSADRATLESFESNVRSLFFDPAVQAGAVTSFGVFTSEISELVNDKANFRSLNAKVDVGMLVQNTTPGKTDQFWVVKDVLSDTKILLEKKPQQAGEDTSSWRWDVNDTYRF